MNKDQSIGAAIFITCLIVAIAYVAALLWPNLEAIRLWLIAIPVTIAFVGVLAIGAWIGWTMASTPPPKPIENIDMEPPSEPEKTKAPEN
jgi:predicted DNA-binding transcriptional regulator